MSRYTYYGENGTRTHSTVTANASGVLVSAKDPDLMAIEFYNNGSVTVYVDTVAAAATAGRPIAAGNSWQDSASMGPWYVATSSSTADVRVTKVRRAVEVNNLP